MGTLYKNTGQVRILQMNTRMSYDLAPCKTSDFNNLKLSFIYRRLIRQKVEFWAETIFFKLFFHFLHKI